MNSILRWAGSKRRLLPRLVPYWQPSHCRYVEPFAGSACLFFELEPTTGILGDLNVDLIDTYETLRSDADGVADQLFEWKADEETYYSVRDSFERPTDSIARAARFIYLNRLCFNGLYRTNKQGHFNVPYGSRSGSMPCREALNRTAKLLDGVQLVAGDFEGVLTQVQQGDFVYMDPPYRVASRRVFREYQPGEFSVEDLARLRQWLENLDSLGLDFVVSYADSVEGRRLGQGFTVQRVRVRRNIAGFAKHRRTAYEVLISNC